jgi:hypothetical protein
MSHSVYSLKPTAGDSVSVGGPASGDSGRTSSAASPVHRPDSAFSPHTNDGQTGSYPNPSSHPYLGNSNLMSGPNNLLSANNMLFHGHPHLGHHDEDTHHQLTDMLLSGGGGSHATAAALFHHDMRGLGGDPATTGGYTLPGASSLTTGPNNSFGSLYGGGSFLGNNSQTQHLHPGAGHSHAGGGSGTPSMAGLPDAVYCSRCRNYKKLYEFMDGERRRKTCSACRLYGKKYIKKKSLATAALGHMSGGPSFIEGGRFSEGGGASGPVDLALLAASGHSAAAAAHHAQLSALLQDLQDVQGGDAGGASNLSAKSLHFLRYLLHPSLGGGSAPGNGNPHAAGGLTPALAVGMTFEEEQALHRENDKFMDNVRWMVHHMEQHRDHPLHIAALNDAFGKHIEAARDLIQGVLQQESCSYAENSASSLSTAPNYQQATSYPGEGRLDFNEGFQRARQPSATFHQDGGGGTHSSSSPASSFQDGFRLTTAAGIGVSHHQKSLSAMSSPAEP